MGSANRNFYNGNFEFSEEGGGAVLNKLKITKSKKTNKKETNNNFAM